MQQDAEIISVLKELYNISGCRMSLYDTHLREIAAYPDALSPFCALVRQNKHADHLCRRQDAVAFEIVRSQGQIYIYRCPFGLHEAVAPLYQYGVLSGFFDDGTDFGFLPDRPDTYHAHRSPLCGGRRTFGTAGP